MTEASALDQINKQAYSATGVVDWYRDFDFLVLNGNGNSRVVPMPGYNNFIHG